MRSFFKAKNTIAIFLVIVMMVTLVSCIPEYTSSEVETNTSISESTYSDEPNTSSAQSLETEIDANENELDTKSSMPEENLEQNNSSETHTHAFAAASCTIPQKCSCGETIGEPNGHRWASATCTTPKTCTVCQTKDGNAQGHKYSNGSCTVCGEKDSSYIPPTNTKTYVLNTKSKKFHLISCSWLPEENREDTTKSRDEIISEGYEPCKRCNP